MTKYNRVNVKLLDSESNKLKSAAKNKIGVTFRFSLNTIDNSDDE